ncbi:MAG: nitroreductase family protein [Capnocytophaga sp.]|nr:nitroreductase family protein [Capnocytophaga sp.]
MSYLELMKKRYSTKKYDAGYRISQPLIDQLKEIIRLTPSSINSQPWHFTIISNPELKKELSVVSYHNVEKVTDCSHVLVLHVLDNLELFEEQLSEINPPYINYFRTLRTNLGDERVRIWLSKQLYIALGVILSACADLGIDATPMEGIINDEYDRIIGIDGYKVVLAVALGKHHPDDFNHPARTPKQRIATARIFTERD